MLKHNCDVVEIRVPITRRKIKLWAIVSYFCLVPRLSHGTIPQRSEGKLTSDDPYEQQETAAGSVEPGDTSWTPGEILQI